MTKYATWHSIQCQTLYKIPDTAFYTTYRYSIECLAVFLGIVQNPHYTKQVKYLDHHRYGVSFLLALCYRT